MHERAQVVLLVGDGWDGVEDLTVGGVQMDTLLRNVDPVEAAARVRETEDAGWEGIWVTETSHDPFLTLAAGAAASNEATLGTAIAVAFARSPMTTAVSANDLSLLTDGRFVLGLGTQVAAHIVKRFSMPWSRPVERMREYVAALRAIWDAWNASCRLDFRGDFYTHTLMTPNFAPPPNPHGRPPVYLAAVGSRMTEMVGECGDGLLAHGFTTERYFREVTLPALARGLDRSGRVRDDVVVCAGALVVSGRDEATLRAAADETRTRLGFYASTPAYRPVLELHGWGDLQTEAHRLTKEGRWQDLPALVDDTILESFAVVGTPGEVATEVRRRFSDGVDRLSLPTLAQTDPTLLCEIREMLRAGST